MITASIICSDWCVEVLWRGSRIEREPSCRYGLLGFGQHALLLRAVFGAGLARLTPGAGAVGEFPHHGSDCVVALGGQVVHQVPIQRRSMLTSSSFPEPRVCWLSPRLTISSGANTAMPG